MRRLIPLAVFCLFVFSLFARDEWEVRLAAEAEPLTTVANCVNVLSGDFFQVRDELIVDRGEPLCLTRYYDGGAYMLSDMGFGNGWPFPLRLRFDPEFNKVLLAQRQGFYLPFYTSKAADKSLVGEIDSVIFSHGYTNCTEAALRGEPCLAKTSLVFDGDYTDRGPEIGNLTRRRPEFEPGKAVGEAAQLE